MSKLLQSRNGYVSQVSSTIGKLNYQLSLSPDEFDFEYAEHMLSKLDSFVNSIEQITVQLCERSPDEETRQKYLEYMTTQKFKVYQIKKSVDLRRPSQQPYTAYAPSYTSRDSQQSEHSYRSLEEKRIKTEAAKRSFLEAKHKVRRAELDEQLEQEMFELMIANDKFMQRISQEIGELTSSKKSVKSPALSTTLPPTTTNLQQTTTTAPTATLAPTITMSTLPSMSTLQPKSTLPTTIEKRTPSQREALDEFIDHLVEGQETELIGPEQAQLSSLHVIRHEFESRSLPTIELTKFNGDSCQWPEFITNFKNRVHLKSTFSDDIRMERLLSCLQGEAANAVESIGSSGMFYATALKTLKRDFGNPAVVAHLKLKSLLEKPQIGANDRIALRQYQQQLKSTVTWLQSIGYSSHLSSTDALSKAVMRLPNRLRQSFFKSTRNKNFGNGVLALRSNAFVFQPNRQPGVVTRGGPEISKTNGQ